MALDDDKRGTDPTVVERHRPAAQGHDDTEPTPSDPRTPGTMPNRYRGADARARGGMGRVIEATDILLGRRVAVPTK